MSLATDITAFAGDTSDPSVHVAAEASLILSKVSEDALRQYAEAAAVTDNLGWSSSGYRIIEVSRGGYIAREASYEQVQRLSDTSSIHHARARDPRYYYVASGGSAKLFCLPEPDAQAPLRIVYVDKNPTVSASDDSVTGVPTEFRRLLVLGAARRVVQERIDARSIDDDSEMLSADIALRAQIDSLYKEEFAMRFGEEMSNRFDSHLRSTQ
ncbi:MAG: hypothetical protein KDB29_14255 [Planctomycetes bacterium]|nr:hypothetical protein [Planctomycetota bacterium]